MQRREFLGLTAVIGAFFTLSKSEKALASQNIEQVQPNNSSIKGISHVGISVSNMDQSLKFYRDTLGLTLLGGKTNRFQGELYENIFQLKDVCGRSAMLSINKMRIELFEFENPRGNKSDSRLPVNHNKINHICFEVHDIQNEYQRLSAAGVYFHCPPQNAGYAKATYGRDPDGNVFELIQWVER